MNLNQVCMTYLFVKGWRMWNSISCLFCTVMSYLGTHIKLRPKPQVRGFRKRFIVHNDYVIMCANTQCLLRNQPKLTLNNHQNKPPIGLVSQPLAPERGRLWVRRNVQEKQYFCTSGAGYGCYQISFRVSQGILVAQGRDGPVPDLALEPRGDTDSAGGRSNDRGVTLHG